MDGPREPAAWPAPLPPVPQPPSLSATFTSTDSAEERTSDRQTAQATAAGAVVTGLLALAGYLAQGTTSASLVPSFSVTSPSPLTSPTAMARHNEPLASQSATPVPDPLPLSGAGADPRPGQTQTAFAKRRPSPIVVERDVERLAENTPDRSAPPHPHQAAMTPGTMAARAQFGRTWDEPGERLLHECLRDMSEWCDRFNARAVHFRRRYLQFTITTLILTGFLAALGALPGVTLAAGTQLDTRVTVFISVATCVLSATVGVIQACAKFMDPEGSSVHCQNASQRCHHASNRILAELGLPRTERRKPSDIFVGVLDDMEAVFCSDAARLLQGPPLPRPAVAWAGNF